MTWVCVVVSSHLLCCCESYQRMCSSFWNLSVHVLPCVLSFLLQAVTPQRASVCLRGITPSHLSRWPRACNTFASWRACHALSPLRPCSPTRPSTCASSPSRDSQVTVCICLSAVMCFNTFVKMCSGVCGSHVRGVLWCDRWVPPPVLLSSAPAECQNSCREHLRTGESMNEMVCVCERQQCVHVTAMDVSRWKNASCWTCLGGLRICMYWTDTV